MDASQIQSGSKCGGSDFSIERILGGRNDSREESIEAPDWLCCTRYRPPRLPRASTVCRSRRAGRHARVPFTAGQAAALEAAYARAPYLAPPALKALAAALQLRDDRIKIWFQNRRARERREKSANIAPPQGITLPPTNIINTFPPSTWTEHTSKVPRGYGHNFVHMQRFDGPANKIERFLSHRPMCDKEEMEERPETPLDIETVDD